MKYPTIAALCALGLFAVGTLHAAPGGQGQGQGQGPSASAPGQASKAEHTPSELEARQHQRDMDIEGEQREREREREREAANEGDGSETSQEMQERRVERKEIQEEYHEGRKAGDVEQAKKKPWWKFWGSESESGS